MAILCLALVVRAMFGPASLVLSCTTSPCQPALGAVWGADGGAGNHLLVPPIG